MSGRGGTRDAIVTAARRLFYAKGFDHTSLADLATFADVPKGNFYYHFKTKDDVLRAVLEARREDIAATLQTWRRELPAPLARIERVVGMLSNERDDLTSYGCPTGSLITELGKDRDDLKGDVVAIMDLFVGFVAEQLEVAGRAPTEARALAMRLLARTQGAVLMAHAYGDPGVLDAEARDILAWVATLIEEA